MVFSTTNLFKGVQCPQGDKCRLIHCIYGHDIVDPGNATIGSVATSKRVDRSPKASKESLEPPSKKRKVTYESLSEKSPSRAELIRSQLAARRTGLNASSAEEPHGDASGTKAAGFASPGLSSLIRPVSPPFTNTKDPSFLGTGISSAANIQNDSNGSHSGQRGPAAIESLNPRLIPNDPAGHAKRSLYLKHLHAEMSRLNESVGQLKPDDPDRKALLTQPELIKLTLDEEEKFARDQPTLYSNVVKQRIAALKKMAMDTWIAHIKLRQTNYTHAATKDEPTIDTGLELWEESLILPHLVIADQNKLASFGYIPIPPSPEAAAEAAAAVEASHNYESCDRCAARFQVFPDRNEQGSLTSNGPCMHHPMRKAFPPRSKTDKETGPKEPYYPCCGEVVGTPGCTRSEEHVFKTSSPARLAAVLPFISTPENNLPEKDRHGKVITAVAFDCEMGYTALGMELIRLTAVSWPGGETLLDTLVRPLGAVIDLNSRFSGVFAEHYKQAVPYDQWMAMPKPISSSDEVSKPLPVVDSPQKAREVLCNFLSPTTPLIGHSIDNDLNVVRLCHPTVVDTVILFPHPRGLPLRLGLKALSQRYLRRNIQMGGARGHDSREDAIATGDLVRVKVGEKWKLLRALGWHIHAGHLVPPPSKPDAGM